MTLDHRRPASLGRWLILAILLSTAPAWAQAPAGLAEFLDDNGRLTLPTDFSGSLDPGGFEMLAADDGSPRFVPEGGAAALPGQWQAFGGVNAGCNGTVHALAVAGSGQIYLGGEFTVCGSVPASRVAVYDPASNQFQALGADAQNGVNATVQALAVSGTDLYVGGRFNQAGGQVANRIARWDGSAWHPLGTGSGIANGVSDWVEALAVVGSDLYVGGRFGSAGGQTASRIARWDGSQWHPLISGGSNGVNGLVTALVVADAGLIVGGHFTLAGDLEANRVARWDGSQWHSLGSGAENGVNSQVESLAVSGTDVYVGGYFSQAGGASANNIARWNGSQWQSLGSGVQQGVLALAVSGTDIYAGGLILQAGGQSANNVVRWDGSQWQRLGTAGSNGTNNVVNALAVSGTALYVGGSYTQAAGAPAKRFARWSASEWEVLGPADENGLGSAVHALAVIGQDLYVAGEFTFAGEQLVNYIARWDGVQWHPLESNGQVGVNWLVYALAVDGPDLYVGGLFWQAGGQTVNRVARWDGSQWHALSSGGSIGVGGQVNALLVAGADLVVGGNFTTAGGQTANRIARWDGSQWHPLGEGAENGVGGVFDSRVNALAFSGGSVYAGGRFTEAGGLPVNHVARWDGVAWHPLSSGGQTGVSSANANLTQVHALAAYQDNVYVGGFFASAGGVSAFNIARWSGNEWHALQGGALSSSVLALQASDEGLFAGGLFIDRVRRWDGTGWASLGQPGNGVNADVLALALQGNRVYLGGRFGIAGGALSSAVTSFAPFDPLAIRLAPGTLLAGQTSALSVTGGFGAGTVAVEITDGESNCALAGTTLTALSAGECTLTATKAADDVYPAQSRTAVARVVAVPGVNLQVGHLVCRRRGFFRRCYWVPSSFPANDPAPSGVCEPESFLFSISNNGPTDADTVRVQIPVPAGIVGPVSWQCAVPGDDCSPTDGQGAVDVNFPLAIGESADIELSACADPNVAFADFRVQASLPDGTALLFPEEAQLNWSAPLNEDGVFRTRFQ